LTTDHIFRRHCAGGSKSTDIREIDAWSAAGTGFASVTVGPEIIE
jgi:hypothetical protein